MASEALPDIHELDGVIADYLDALFPVTMSAIEREMIIQRCLEPFTQLVFLWESVQARSFIEKKIWRTFVRDLSLMSDLPTRTKTAGSDYHNVTLIRKDALQLEAIGMR